MVFEGVGVRIGMGNPDHPTHQHCNHGFLVYLYYHSPITTYASLPLPILTQLEKKTAIFSEAVYHLHVVSLGSYQSLTFIVIGCPFHF